MVIVLCSLNGKEGEKTTTCGGDDAFKGKKVECEEGVRFCRFRGEICLCGLSSEGNRGKAVRFFGFFSSVFV